MKIEDMFSHISQCILKYHVTGINTDSSKVPQIYRLSLFLKNVSITTDINFNVYCSGCKTKATG